MDGTRRCVVGAWVEDTPLWRKVSVDGGVEPSFCDWQWNDVHRVCSMLWKQIKYLVDSHRSL